MSSRSSRDGTTGPTLDFEQSLAQLELMFPSGVPEGAEIHLFALVPVRGDCEDQRPRLRRGLMSFDEIERAVKELEQSGATLIAVRPMLYHNGEGDPPFGRIPSAPNSQQEWLHSTTTLWVDLDFDSPATDSQLKTAVRALKRFKWPPTFLVFTGGGVHAYWTLARALPLETAEQRARYSGLREALRQLLGEIGPWSKADAGAKGITQPARLAGTVNRKANRPPKPAKLVVLDERRTYRQKDLPKPVRTPTPQPAGRMAKGKWCGVLGELTAPDIELPMSAEAQDALDEVISRDSHARQLWNGRCKTTDLSRRDFRFGCSLMHAVYERVDGDRECWQVVMAELIAQRRARDRDEDKPGRSRPRDPQYLGRTVEAIWNRNMKRDLGRTDFHRRIRLRRQLQHAHN